MLKIKLDRAASDASLPVLMNDQLLFGDNGGVQFIADFANSYSYPTAAAPVNGTHVLDVSKRAADAAWIVPAGQTLGWGGNGVDFTPVTDKNMWLGLPATVFASLWAAANQYFIECCYIKVPAQADFASFAGISPLFSACPASTYTTSPEVALMGMSGSGSPNFTMRRQTALNATEQANINTIASDYGMLAQISCYRTAAGFQASIRTASGRRYSGLISGGANNTVNFSAAQAGFGPTSAFGLSGTTADKKWKAYRCWIENLAISGRDPVTVLDADWNRTIARGVFS